MSSQIQPVPAAKRFLTPGVWVLIALTLASAGFWIVRMFGGLGAVTNVSDRYPWGIWAALKASGVALAAGGFTVSALAHIFRRERYHVLVRPAVLTATLGYSFVAFWVFTDLGQWYYLWHVMFPPWWQGNSVLFEVGVCVMAYLTVLYVELLPAALERFEAGRAALPDPFSRFDRLVERIVGKPWVQRLMRGAHLVACKTMFLFIIAGVVFSCLHQSSLGALMVIAPTKTHPLWYSPLLPLLFLLSAVPVGLAVVICESMLSHRFLGLRVKMEVLSPLSRILPLLLGLYLSFKLGDLVVRDAHRHLLKGGLEANLFLAELGAGVLLPLILLLSDRLRRSPVPLFLAAALVPLGVVLNRINVFVIAYKPPYAKTPYYPALGEYAIAIGFLAAVLLLYRALVTILPVISPSVGDPGKGLAELYSHGGDDEA